MTTTAPEIQKCKCGDDLLVHPGTSTTMCRHEDFPTAAEMHNGVPMIILDGHPIADPFAPSIAIKGSYMRAHDAMFAKLKIEAYGSENAA